MGDAKLHSQLCSDDTYTSTMCMQVCKCCKESRCCAQQDSTCKLPVPSARVNGIRLLNRLAPRSKVDLQVKSGGALASLN